jgi:chromosomal replication initiation ATPase DnaA
VTETDDSTIHARQLVFDLQHRPAMGREDFLVTPCNSAAVEAIDAWPHWQHHSLALVGPAASGKTHLASVWQTTSNAIVKAALDLSIDTVPEFLATSAVVIEDMGQEKFDEPALFHLLNMAREGKAYVLLTSHIPPAHWRIELPDLASRLRATPLVEINPPDDLLLRAVLVKLFSDRQLKVEETVINYLLLRMERSIKAATRVVEALDQAALSRKVRIGRRLTKEVLVKLEDDETGGVG